MQRRAVAAYAFFFVVALVIAGAALSTAQAPVVYFEDPDRELSSGDTLTVDGVQYTASVSEGSAEVSWRNDSFQFSQEWANGDSVELTETWEHGETVTLPDGEWYVAFGVAGSSDRFRLVKPASGDSVTVRDGSVVVDLENGSTVQLGNYSGAKNRPVRVDHTLHVAGNHSTVTAIQTESATTVTPWSVEIPNASDPASFDLVEPLPENVSTTEVNGSTYAVVTRNGSRTLIDPMDYPGRTTLTVEEGDSLPVGGNRTTVGNVTEDTVPLTWTGSKTSSKSISDADTVTIGSRTYATNIWENDTLQLSRDEAALQEDLDRIDAYEERTNGLWGVIDISVIVLILLFGLSFLPRKV